MDDESESLANVVVESAAAQDEGCLAKGGGSSGLAEAYVGREGDRGGDGSSPGVDKKEGADDVTLEQGQKGAEDVEKENSSGNGRAGVVERIISMLPAPPSSISGAVLPDDIDLDADEASLLISIARD